MCRMSRGTGVWHRTLSQEVVNDHYEFFIDVADHKAVPLVRTFTYNSSDF